MSALSSEQDTEEREVQRLQHVIRDQRAALDAATVGTAAYQPALAAVLEATVQLVNHEAGIPVRRREGYSARTAKIVRRNGLVTTPIVAVVAVLTFTPWLSAWWLLLLVPLLALAVLIAVTASAAAPSDRSTRRTVALTWAVTVIIDLALIIVSHRLPSWLTAVLMVAATVGGLVAAGQLTCDLDSAEPSDTES
jgi:hypothetical protein